MWGVRGTRVWSERGGGVGDATPVFSVASGNSLTSSSSEAFTNSFNGSYNGHLRCFKYCHRVNYVER